MDASPYYSCQLMNAYALAASVCGFGTCSTCIICHPTQIICKQAPPFIVREIPKHKQQKKEKQK